MRIYSGLADLNVTWFGWVEKMPNEELREVSDEAEKETEKFAIFILLHSAYVLIDYILIGFKFNNTYTLYGGGLTVCISIFTTIVYSYPTTLIKFKSTSEATYPPGHFSNPSTIVPFFPLLTYTPPSFLLFR
jgi:hypothetical protein